MKRYPIRQDRAPGPVQYVLLILAAKLWVIARYGSPLPHWDQWTVEAEALYPRYFAGTLRLPDLFGFWNEHRIFWTRALALAELRLYGTWQPLLQMGVNAGNLSERPGIWSLPQSAYANPSKPLH
jgi:hypothetical protein